MMAKRSRRLEAPAPVDTKLDTETLLIDTAERLFALHGYGAVSVRAVTVEAGANIAAVHYYFGGKIDLLRAIFLRRSASLNAEREKLLDACAADADGRLQLSDVLYAFVAPPFRTYPVFARLSAKISVETSAEVRAVTTDTIGLVVPRFIDALSRACPQLDRAQIAWRFDCVIGVIMHARVDTGFVRKLTGEDVSMSDPERALEAIMPFLVAGFAAPR